MIAAHGYRPSRPNGRDPHVIEHDEEIGDTPGPAPGVAFETGHPNSVESEETNCKHGSNHPECEMYPIFKKAIEAFRTVEVPGHSREKQ